MKSLHYAFLDNKIIEGFEENNNVSDTIQENEIILNKINNNEENIDEELNKLRYHDGLNIKYTDLKENKKFKQMETDYKSMILQDKFLLALGGITFASLIILGTQL
tara:strand:+ start:3914 stop:4231 length:318 start_codon:yes stop_codon:yes gene_type:complete